MRGWTAVTWGAIVALSVLGACREDGPVKDLLSTNGGKPPARSDAGDAAGASNSAGASDGVGASAVGVSGASNSPDLHSLCASDTDCGDNAHCLSSGDGETRCYIGVPGDPCRDGHDCQTQFCEVSADGGLGQCVIVD